MSNYQSFYDERRHLTYAQDYSSIRPEMHSGYKELRSFVDRFHLSNKKYLEIGSSGGFFQDMVQDYYGTDIAECLAEHYHKPYRIVNRTHYPFEDEMFDAIWTINVFEHILQLSEVMFELRRLLKPGRVLFFSPAWQCRP
jgi:2-polyprenyl-3-methyl-5-hydroxy-6-metoxy-1,4-benzoquinol methylase